MSALYNFHTEEAWSQLLEALREVGCVVTAGVGAGVYRHPAGREIPWDTFFVCASPAQAPKLKVAHRKVTIGF